MQESILSRIKSKRTYFDGGMGTLLQAAGLSLGELPERWNLTHPETVKKIHKEYLSAGADIIKSNTFGANPLKFPQEQLNDVVTAGLKLAREAVEEAGRGYVALDVGPCGKLLKPYGDLDFESAVDLFKSVIEIGAKYADCVLIETMNDAYETKAAVLAAKESCSLPIFVTNVYGEDGKLMTGADVKTMIAILEGLGVDALGLNCSLGVEQMLALLPTFTQNASLPLIVNPNAGLPKELNGKTVYGTDSERFSDLMVQVAESGAAILGGCCGTTPAFIQKTIEKTRAIPLSKGAFEEKGRTVVSSYTHIVEFKDKTVLIGERINPTGKKRFKQALREKDIDYILQEGLRQQESGAEVLDVNVGLPEIDEREMLLTVTTELQAVCDTPLQIDTTDPIAMEKALRYYNGKPLVNSVSGKQESMDAIFPLVQKYGGVVVALTLDEEGIPATAQGRWEIAQKILREASRYGIEKKDILFDPLAMAISSDTSAAITTLQALELIIKNGCKTSLGVSNVSFGLPNRETVHANFFSSAMEKGLSAAILNVFSADMMKAYYAFNALHDLDDNCAEYISFATERLPKMLPQTAATFPTAVLEPKKDENSDLQTAIVKGLKDKSAVLTAERLKKSDAMRIINEEIIPALDHVGKGFEKKTIFLPQLLMSAESAKSAFEVIKDHLAKEGTARQKRLKFVLATVYGDIHDIGKNIVKVLLENYAFEVIDLGKDVPVDTIVQTVLETRASIVGLSALMTTTVPSMKVTIQKLKEKAPWCQIVVGGAVLTQEYADAIGADRYSKDAMETVRFAEWVEEHLQ